MIARFMAVLTTGGFIASLLYFWYWIGSHFTDAPAQAVLGFGPIAVGMLLFFLVLGGIWLVLGVIWSTVSYIVKG
jgi:hypothetical protein